MQMERKWLQKQVIIGSLFLKILLYIDGINEIKAIANQDGNRFEDVARFNKVNEPNPSYKAPEEEGGTVSNWFEMPEGVEDVVVEELTLLMMCVQHAAASTNYSKMKQLKPSFISI